MHKDIIAASYHQGVWDAIHAEQVKHASMFGGLARGAGKFMQRLGGNATRSTTTARSLGGAGTLEPMRSSGRWMNVGPQSRAMPALKLRPTAPPPGAGPAASPGGGPMRVTPSHFSAPAAGGGGGAAGRVTGGGGAFGGMGDRFGGMMGRGREWAQQNPATAGAMGGAVAGGAAVSGVNAYEDHRRREALKNMNILQRILLSMQLIGAPGRVADNYL